MKGERKTALVIRFKGFSDAWEQRELMSVFEFPVSTNSLSRSQLNYDNGEIKSVHYGDILVNYDSILEIAKDRIPFITNGVIDKYKPNLLENGDLIFADAAEDETVGKAVEVDGKINEYIVAGLHTIVARPRRKMAKFFWGYYINSSIYHNQLLRLMQGTKVASISKSNLQKTCIAYPDNFAEQQKLGNFFKQLDDTIALHQRKLEALKLMKKGFLQQIFPKKGEKVPRLRFADFEEEWEQRKLGEVVERVIRKNKNLKSTLPLTISAKEGLIAQNEFFNKTVASRDVSGYYLVKNGEFAYNKSYSNGYPWGAIKRLNHYDMGVLSTLYIVFKPTNINSDFLEKYYDTTYWHKEISKHAAEGARNHGLLNIAATDFFESKLTVPKDCDEQEKVGMLFCHLDEIIILYQKKLNQFYKLKKVYLQKMFI
ncbi:restriction endonuclease subunit S [Listeria seeligeri]|uniref:restriction endonuclease subunit S n=1 Tax=Listeria seeligeri TaxID=1640 RepID=UPI0016233486|nr:restriction endonuclease subunit S [Listeria seeligeri]MBC2088191.1 restriction endonuclease subunit S [Listeria seeligeri]MBF2592078.1 restriction endonuclease subunit S [Listeria seeligeri]